MRRALVTGASSGIGEATARCLAERGYRVALLARRAERLAEVLDSLPGAGHLALRADVADEGQLAEAFETLAREFGGLELVVNNAGAGYRARVGELDVELVNRTLATNVTGPLLVARAALPLLRRGERPVLVNVASVVGRRGIPGQSVYSASKAALVSIGEALRLEWAREGIAVCTLSPGLTSTGFFDAQPNPARLADPDLARSDSARAVAEEVVALDVRPRAERVLRAKWRWLGVLSALAPRFADRMLAKRIGGDW
jgi:NAD(P)-dependent dehydrogenase (short-subunit alcohol dehydrogenase family)